MKTYFKIVTTLILTLSIISCKGENKPDMKADDSKNKQTSQSAVVAPQLKVQKVEVVRKFEHDKNAFTQGFVFFKGFLYESTGLKGESTLRKLNPETGKILKNISIEDDYFAEGITIFDSKIYQITWVNGKCLIYNSNDFTRKNIFTYAGEGWGITNDEKSLIMSDGTNVLRFRNPETFEIEKSIAVVDADMNPVHYLNELEMINGEIWANIWQLDKIVRIEPITGKVLGWIDISSLREYLKFSDKVDVLNGIAWDSKNDRIYLTGKYWPWIFEVKLVD